MIEAADGGTLFLDEIGGMSPLMQLKLLRVLQEREIQRVGATQPRKVDVCPLTATNKDLSVLLTAGSFRKVLYLDGQFATWRREKLPIVSASK